MGGSAGRGAPPGRRRRAPAPRLADRACRSGRPHTRQPGGARTTGGADAAGHLRYAWPTELGGRGGSNLDMAVIREHLAAKGLGLHNDLQNEHSIVGNNPFVVMFKEFAPPDQIARDSEKLLAGQMK